MKWFAAIGMFGCIGSLGCALWENDVQLSIAWWMATMYSMICAGHEFKDVK